MWYTDEEEICCPNGLHQFVFVVPKTIIWDFLDFKRIFKLFNETEVKFVDYESNW